VDAAVTTTGIALVGPMASGKSTLAATLVERYGYERLSMIGAFRELFAEAYPGIGKGDEIAVERDRLCRSVDCPEFDSLPGHVHAEPITYSGRGLMQAFAPACRSVDNLFWNRVAFNRVAPRMAAGIKFVSDDVRYRSEARMCREHGLIVVRVETPREVRMERYRALYGRYPTPDEEGAATEVEIDRIGTDLTVSGTADVNLVAAQLASVVGRSSSVRIPIRKD
jgi:hypothetical protein